MFEGPPTQLLEASDSTSRTLLERVQLRDPEAWRKFVHLYGPVVYGWGRRSNLQPHDAADVAQEVFHAVSLNIVKFRREKPGDSFRGWLRTITTNKIRDHFRNRDKQAIGGSAVDAPAVAVPDDEPPASAICDLAHRALELIHTDFEPSTWQAFLRCAVDGRTAAEAAAELGLSVAAVHKAKSRVLHRLRSELDGLVE